MAMLDNIPAFDIQVNSASTVRLKIAQEAWRWFRENSDLIVLSLLAGLVKVRVRNLRHLFELLFGSEK
jgi:hypothetical protein